MTIKLISLVVITLFLLSGHSYSEEQFLFPKKKPSIFKDIKNSNKIDLSKSLPQRKPLIEKEEDIFNRGYKIKKIEIDSSFPEYILKNKEELKEWIA